MKIRLWHGVNNESWREHTDSDQEAADELRERTENLLLDQGHKIVTAYQQNRGVGVVCQTPEADDIVDDAMSAARAARGQ